MSACTQNIICLGIFCSCGNIELPLEYSGDSLLMVAQFNGVQLRKEVNTANTAKITIPNIFNENYVHILHFVEPDGTVLNGSYYSLTIQKCLYPDGDAPIMPTNYNTSIVITGMSGADVIDDRMIGKIVTGLIINDASKNQGFTKNLDSDTLTFTDGTTISSADIITIIFQK